MGQQKPGYKCSRYKFNYKKIGHILKIKHSKVLNAFKLIELTLKEVSSHAHYNTHALKGHVKRSFCIEIIDDHTSDLGVQAILSNCMKERNF